MQLQPLFVSLHPVFDSMAHILLEPETLGASASIPIAAQTLLQSGRDLPPALYTRLQTLTCKDPPSDLELSEAYAKLFLDGPHPISLRESAWVNSEQQLSPNAQNECKTTYEKAGLELTDDAVVPEDHLGLMFGFLAVMSLRNDVATGLEFYRAHIAPLTGVLTAAIREHRTQAGPYLDVADILDTISIVLT